MIEIVNSQPEFNRLPIYQLWDKEDDQVLAYQRGNLIFIFNFNGHKSFPEYGILAEKGSYKTVLNTDNPKFGGFGLVDDEIIHHTLFDPEEPGSKEWLKFYIPARSAMVLRKV
jgi:1,4-alpha-glucan branching enzyme